MDYLEKCNELNQEVCNLENHILQQQIMLEQQKKMLTRQAHPLEVKITEINAEYQNIKDYDLAEKQAKIQPIYEMLQKIKFYGQKQIENFNQDIQNSQIKLQNLRVQLQNHINNQQCTQDAKINEKLKILNEGLLGEMLSRFKKSDVRNEMQDINEEKKQFFKNMKHFIDMGQRMDVQFLQGHTEYNFKLSSLHMESMQTNYMQPQQIPPNSFNPNSLQRSDSLQRDQLLLSSTSRSVYRNNYQPSYGISMYHQQIPSSTNSNMYSEIAATDQIPNFSSVQQKRCEAPKITPNDNLPISKLDQIGIDITESVEDINWLQKKGFNQLNHLNTELQKQAIFQIQHYNQYMSQLDKNLPPPDYDKSFIVYNINSDMVPNFNNGIRGEGSRITLNVKQILEELEAKEKIKEDEYKNQFGQTQTFTKNPNLQHIRIKAITCRPFSGYMDSKVVIRNYKISQDNKMGIWDDAIRPQEEKKMSFINSEKEEQNDFGVEW